MSGEGLDNLARALAATASRRQMVKLTLGAAFGGLLARTAGDPLPAAAAPCQPGYRTCVEAAGGNTTVCCPPGGSCSYLSAQQPICCLPPAHAPPGDLLGLCVCASAPANSGQVCSVGGGAYTCCPSHAHCTVSSGVGDCLCDDGYTNADAGLVTVACCEDGVTHPDNGQCLCDNTNQPPGSDGKCEPCGPGNCTGCCTDKGCQHGILSSACGSGGAPCAVCPDHGHCTTVASNLDFQCICEGTNQPPAGGVCPDHCGPDTCAGCCYVDPSGNVKLCLAGTNDGVCGAGGQHCQVCPGKGEASCTNGQCLCLTNNQPPCGTPSRCCPAGGTCVNGACICTVTGKPPTLGITGFLTCPDCGPCTEGCCLADTGIIPNPPQQCIPYVGQGDPLCGANGAVCVPCPSDQVCRQGVCICKHTGNPPDANGRCGPGCDANNCPHGCCDATLNCIQLADQTNAQCGTRGETCTACPTGAVCQDYISDAFGHPDLGQQCVCSTSGQPPANNTCPPCNSTTCPNGCCDGAGVCQPGTGATACGSGGERCANCGAGGNCQKGTCGCPSANSTCPGGTTFCSLQETGQFCRAVCCPSTATCPPTSEASCDCNTTDAYGNQGVYAQCLTNNNQPNAPYVFACCGSGTVCATNADATSLGLIGRSLCCPVAQTCCSYGKVDVSKPQAACFDPICCGPNDSCCPGTVQNGVELVPNVCCPPGSSCTGPGTCTKNTSGTCGTTCTSDNDCGGGCLCIGAGAGVSGACGIPT